MKMNELKKIIKEEIENIQQKSSSINNADELSQKVIETIKKHFPKSFVSSKFKNSLAPSISFYFTVASGKEQLVGGIPNNDISYTIGIIYGVNEDGTLKDILDFSPVQGGSFIINPTEKFMAYGTYKVGLKKVKGSPEKILKHIDTYFGKLHQAILQNINNIPKRLLEPIKDNL